MPSIFSEPSLSKSNAYKRSWSNFNKERFTLDYLEKDWDLIFNVEKNDVNHSFDKHAQLKKVSKYQLKLKTKSWNIAAIHKSILVTNFLLKKYIKLKNPVKKTETHDKYKYYKNLTPTVFKKSKKIYYNEFSKI